MKPVSKEPSPGPFSDYREAKPKLLERMGSHCSYCEEYGSPQNLHVEHIYPQKAHPELKMEWSNFLISCISCNSFKNYCLGSLPQTNLEMCFVWPHLDNTANAFKYFDDGRVEPSPNVSQPLTTLCSATIEMVGLMKHPEVADSYDPGIAYDGMSKRKELWEIAVVTREDYLKANDVQRAKSLAQISSKLGHFSIWMEVFQDRPEVRLELIKAFKADPACFDPITTQPIQKGRV